jgi:5-methylcytosine-specific restriction endonuclease McrA
MIQCENDLLLNLIALTPKNARREFRQQIFKDWDWQCAYCSKQLNENTATIDHIVPKYKGGHNVRSNMCCCCSQCNRDKASTLIEDWYTEKNINYCEKRFVRLKSWMEQKFYPLQFLPADKAIPHITNDVSIGWVSS